MVLFAGCQSATCKFCPDYRGTDRGTMIIIFDVSYILKSYINR